MTCPSRQRLRFAAKFALVTAVLGVFFLTRSYALEHWPLNGRHNYPFDFEYSLSLVAGQGLHTAGALEGPAGVPLLEFLSFKRRALSPAELDAHFSTVDLSKRLGIEHMVASSRILDLYVAALVWKLGGVDWDNLYFVYCLVNTASCLLVFLIARRLAGSYWAGLFAATLYCAFPLQSYLTIFSLRDSSPLWFAVAGFYLLICVADRCRRGWANALTFFALGVTPALGLGWRYDAAMLVPVLGAALVVCLLARRRGWRYVAGASVLFLAGAGLAVTGIDALCHFQRMKTSTGYHIGFYGENTRCNELGLENSFQIDWCDLHSFFQARRLALASAGSTTAPLPGFLSEEHYQQCKVMYLAALRYNAFNILIHFPEFFWRVQGGLPQPGTVQGMDGIALSLLMPPCTQNLHRVVFRPVLGVLAWLVVLGAVAALVVGAEPVASLCLLGFAALYALIFLLVLPMQKHLALTLLPASIFGGIGAWALLRLSRPAVWLRGTMPLLRGWPLRRFALGTAIAAALWGLACLGAYSLSTHERAGYVRAVRALASRGTPAPETLRGKQLFSVRLAPSTALTETGYLLTVHAGAHPGTLVCRHIHHSHPAVAGKVYWTNHHLIPNQTQYFVVSCCQGAAYGDPRPYTCTVSVEDGAEIVASTRLDLSHWDRPSLSMVFHDGERQPGSPRVKAPSSTWLFANMLVCGSPAAGATPWCHAAGINPRSYTAMVNHLVARDRKTGAWRFALSGGCYFSMVTLGNWVPNADWREEALIGDFDGDGLPDVAGREEPNGHWWVALANGAGLENKSWGFSGPAVDEADVAVGDFNGDGFDDVFLRDQKTGMLRVALSRGKCFDHACWGYWSPEVAWAHVRVGDFNGDGKSDVAGFDPATGSWWVARSTGTAFENRCWGQWPAGVAWRHVVVGDFNGDGKSDLAGWDPKTGQWWVALSRGDGFECRPVALTNPSDPWEDVAVGDVDGDGRQDLVGRSAKTGWSWVLLAGANDFKPQTWGAMPGTVRDLCVADFDGDGRADVAWRDPGTGQLWVGRSLGTAFKFECWGLWPTSEDLLPLRVYRPWR
jgi:FG-GAP-like repeat/FG-GAP repeat